jgi:hypothetical protein
MNADQLRKIGLERYGRGWVTKLASEIGVDHSTVSKWASGKNKIPLWAEKALATRETKER